MRNPFEKKDHKPLIGGILLGALAAGAAMYYYRDQVARFFDTFFMKEQNADTHEDPQAYLHPKLKAPKTDREKLLHGQILHQSPSGEHQEGQQS